MYSATAKRARARVAKDCRWYISFFRAAKKDSAAALSQHTPVRPRLRRIPFLAVNAANSAEVYCVPLMLSCVSSRDLRVSRFGDCVGLAGVEQVVDLADEVALEA